MLKEGKVYLNGGSLPGGIKPKQVLGEIFLSVVNLDCWSYEALKELYVEGIKMVFEVVGKVTNAAKLIKYVPKNREEMLVRIYETVLSSEGLSCLPGFGFSNRFGDKLTGNPERQSLYEKGD